MIGGPDQAGRGRASRPGLRLRRLVAAFVRSRDGGAMIIGGALAMLLVSSLGGVVVNHGWREAQQEEIRSALRAAVGASAHLLRGDVAAAGEAIKKRVAGFMGGLLDRLTISKDDVSVVHDAATNRTTISVGGNAKYLFANLWARLGDGNPSPVREAVAVEFSTSQFEFALALDVSRSMGQTPPGWTSSRLDVMKQAVGTIATTVDSISRTNPGVIALSVVPFANVVNVADTSGTLKTAAKERYVRMLAGADYSTQTARDSEAHWVDTFHAYGSGSDMGPLASRDLPDFQDPADWNLRQPGTEDISKQAPGIGTWSFEGEDFWNGCVMARWGAYWDPDARPAVWDAGDSDNWPAQTHVSGWAPGSARLRDLPLHMSDAPPDASDPNTRFTAYSWPDARIHGFADTRLSQVMQRTIDPNVNLISTGAVSNNHWHLRATGRGGSLFCPEASIVPLTDDLASIQAVQSYNFVQTPPSHEQGQTYLHLGIVWGLRTLSPLWRDVWKTENVANEALPRTPCGAAATAQGCSRLVNKAIVIVSDGANAAGQMQLGRSFYQGPAPANVRYTAGQAVTANPDSAGRHGKCYWESTNRASLGRIMTAVAYAADPAAFAGSFDVEADGTFTAAGLSRVLDAFRSLHPDLESLDPVADQATIAPYRTLWSNVLQNMTPWQLFRGHDRDSPTKGTDAIDVLMDPDNDFGFTTGRPVQNWHYCRPHMPFGAYGRPEELVNVGDGPPVASVAPFSFIDLYRSPPARDGMLTRYSNLRGTVINRLDDWFLESCRIAGQRGVRIHAVYIGNRTSWTRRHIRLLEDCVDWGHMGNQSVDEVHVTPTAQELRDAINSIITIRRNLRFI